MDADTVEDQVLTLMNSAITGGTMASHTKHYRQGNHERDPLTFVDHAKAYRDIAEARSMHASFAPTFNFMQAVIE